MIRTSRSGLGLLATAALLSGCVIAPQPQTVTLPNPFAVLNPLATGPAQRTYTSAPAGSVYQPAPASYGTYAQSAPSYTVPASSYAPLSQEYQAVNTGMSLPASTVVDSGTYTLGTMETVSAPAMMETMPSYAASAPMPSYSMSVPATSSTYAIDSVPTFGTIQSAPVQAAPVQAAVVQTAPERTMWVEVAPVQAAPMPAAPMQSMPMQSMPVQASGTTYDLTMDGGTTYDLGAGGGYGASITPAPAYDTGASMGGSFQVVPPSLPSTGGVATYSAPTISGGTLSY